MNEKTFKTQMAKLSALYDKPLNQGMLTVYWESLRDYEDQVVVEAVKRHIVDPEQGPWMPKPAHLIRQITGTQAELEAHRKTVAYEAWEDVRCQLSHNTPDLGPMSKKALEKITTIEKAQLATEFELAQIERKFIEQISPMIEGPIKINADTQNLLEVDHGNS